MMWFRKREKQRVEEQVAVTKAATEVAQAQAVKSIEKANRQAVALRQALKDDHIVILIRKATSNG